MHDLANACVFYLDLVAESNGVGRRLRAQHTLGKVPLEDRDTTFSRQGKHDVEGHVVGIAVQHPVGKNPEVLSLITAGSLTVPALNFFFIFRSTNRARLARVE